MLRGAPGIARVISLMFFCSTKIKKIPCSALLLDSYHSKLDSFIYTVNRVFSVTPIVIQDVTCLPVLCISLRRKGYCGSALSNIIFRRKESYYFTLVSSDFIIFCKKARQGKRRAWKSFQNTIKLCVSEKYPIFVCTKGPGQWNSVWVTAAWFPGL